MKTIGILVAIGLFVWVASPPAGESVYAKVQRIKPECLNVR
jgi:hypothetical protein